MPRLLALRVLLPAALVVLAFGQCFPVDPAVVKGTISSSLSCDRLFAPTLARVRIDPSGVYFKPLFTQIPINELVCPEEIISVFRRKNRLPVLLWRPAVKATFFKKSHPKLYARYLVEKKNFQFDLTDIIDVTKFVQFPCENVKVQRVPAFGPRRKLFISLVKKMVAGVKQLRDHSCLPQMLGGKTEVSVKTLDRELRRAAIGNNALAYLYNLAYSNFFCV